MKTTSFIPLIFVLSSGDLGRLKTEINMEAGNQKTTTVNGKKIVYTYSSYGDVLQRQYFNVQRGPSGFVDSTTSARTDRFGYTNLDWRNQCDSTNINGVSSALSYDAIGNPLTYRDGMQMTWQNGRQLKKLTAPNGKMLQFSYDLNGQRQTKVERSYGNVVHTTKYFYDGTKLAGEKKDDTIVWYDYDENGAPVGMRVNGLDYIFRKNLQGDITGIYNSSAELIVEYTYSDAWGAGVTVSGSQASTIGMYNSFRYRGYYYDTESGLYYLNSRYYDPVACRFINADSQLNTNEGNSGYNLYSYCGNNPVMYTDPSGHSILGILGLSAVLIGMIFGFTASTPVSDSPSNNFNYSTNKDPINPNIPPNPESGYVPPENNPNPSKVKNPNGAGKGWPSNNGGVWVPNNRQDGGPGWTVQFPNGSHEHRYPSGHVRKHDSSGQNSNIKDVIIGGAIIAGAGAGIIFIMADDVTGVGVIDDATLPALFGALAKGAQMVVG